MTKTKLNALLATTAALLVGTVGSGAVANDWSGLYGGVSASLHDGENKDYFEGTLFSDPSFINPDTRTGTMFGAYLGYRFQTGNFVFGPELSVYTGTLKMKSVPENKIENYQQAVFKAGYAVDRVLMSGGLGYFEGKIAPKCLATCGKAKISGPVFAVGLDYLITDSITLGAVVQHRRFKDAKFPLLEERLPGFTSDGKDTSLEVRIGYKF